MKEENIQSKVNNEEDMKDSNVKAEPSKFKAFQIQEGLTHLDTYAGLSEIDPKFKDSEIFSMHSSETVGKKVRPEQQACNDIFGHKESFLPTKRDLYASIHQKD